MADIHVNHKYVKIETAPDYTLWASWMHNLTIHTFNRNSLLLNLSSEVHEGPKQVATIMKRAAESAYW